MFGFLMTLYTFNCFLLVLVIMIQQGKGGLGLGALGGSSQMLFGATGGQDLFQKITWTLGAIFMFGSLSLSLYRTQQYRTATFIRQPRQIQQPVMPTQQPQVPTPTIPAAPDVTE